MKHISIATLLTTHSAAEPEVIYPVGQQCIAICDNRGVYFARKYQRQCELVVGLPKKTFPILSASF